MSIMVLCVALEIKRYHAVEQNLGFFGQIKPLWASRFTSRNELLINAGFVPTERGYLEGVA